MNDKDTQNDMNKMLFANLVMMLGSSAIQQLGKLINPLTGKTEISLEGAQITIDMLSMLREKTKGNLDNEEDKMLTDLLSSLQLNYVETAEAAKVESEKKEDKKADVASEPAKVESASTVVEPGSAKESKAPKYHKSYGA
jgi:hypothetical protein